MNLSLFSYYEKIRRLTLQQCDCCFSQIQIMKSVTSSFLCFAWLLSQFFGLSIQMRQARTETLIQKEDNDLKENAENVCIDQQVKNQIINITYIQSQVSYLLFFFLLFSYVPKIHSTRLSIALVERSGVSVTGLCVKCEGPIRSTKYASQPW